MKLVLSVTIANIIPVKFGIVDNLVYRHTVLKNKDYEKGGILPLVKKLGFDGLELIISHKLEEKTVDSLKETLERNKTPVLSIHQPFFGKQDLDLDFVNYLFNIAKKLSAEIIVIHISSFGSYIHNQNFINYIKSKERNFRVKIAVENLPPRIGRPKMYYDKNLFPKMLRTTGFDMTFDTTHFALVGNIIDLFLTNKTKIINIHLSDHKNTFNKLEYIPNFPFGGHLPLGNGDLPIIELLKVLKEERYNGLLTLEIISNTRELVESVEVIRSNF